MLGADHHGVVERILSNLREYTEKLAAAEKNLQWAYWIGASAVVAPLAVLYANVIWLTGAGDRLWGTVLSPLLLIAGLVAAFHLSSFASRRTAVQLAAWRLRRVYQLASRTEDIGPRLDSARHLELELRLSEAQFLLNRAERLGPPSSEEAQAVLRQLEEPIASSESTPSPTSKDEEPLPEFIEPRVP